MEKTKKCKGIYCWVNKINGKRYVGQTGCKGGFSKRWSQEKYYLNNNMSERLNKHFCSAWKKYGAENFEPIILEIIDNPTKEQLVEREQYWCDFYKSNIREFGYNKRLCVESNLGFKYDEETKAKMIGILSGENNGTAKLSWEKVNFIRENFASGIYTTMEFAKNFNVDRSTITNIVKNITWKDTEYAPPLKTTIKKIKIKHKLPASGEKISKEMVLEIRNKFIDGKYLYKDLSKEYGIDTSSICEIIKCKTWNFQELIPDNYLEKLEQKIMGNKKLNKRQVIEIRNKYGKDNITILSLSKEYGVGTGTIQSIISNKNWKDNSYVPTNKGVYKLTKEEVLEIRKKGNSGILYRNIAEEYGVDISTIGNIMKCKIWKDEDCIPENFNMENKTTKGELNKRAKLTEKQVLEIREKFKNGISKKELVDEFNISRRTVERIIQYKIWKHI